jgi:hypothetical protein
MHTTYLVCYDVRDDKRLLARCLAGEIPRYHAFVTR